MSAAFGVWLGDSFAEISFLADSGDKARGSDSTLTTKRWFHPKKSLADMLREETAAHKDGGLITIASSRAEMSVARKQGTEPVTLLTAGFETWARHGQLRVNSSPSLKPSREWFPSSPDKVFGIDERIHEDGSVGKPLKTDELEFLVAKLELLKTREIAIAFLHGARFPQHEKEAADFFRARGFNVTCSSELPRANDMTDVERIRRTVESAFSETVVQDDLTALREAVGETWTIQFWTAHGVKPSAPASVLRGGVEAALANAMPDRSYFFGLEEFLGFAGGESYLLPVQPTCQIAASMWPFPSWSGVDRGYEPGPMLFGKSHQLTLLDILYVRDRLSGDIEGFSDRVNAKATARIHEALFTLGKNLAEPGRRAVDPKDLAEDLESAFVERMVMDIAFRGLTNVVLAGPLASSVQPLLQKRRPDVKFTLDSDVSIASCALKAANAQGAQ